jgi:hypothetical protein
VARPPLLDWATPKNHWQAGHPQRPWGGFGHLRSTLDRPIWGGFLALGGGGPATPKAKKKKNRWPAGVVGPPPMGCRLPFFFYLLNIN